MHIFSLPMDLVGAGHGLVEFFQRNGNQAGMGHPGAVVPVGGFTGLVRPDLVQRFAVFLRVVLDGDLCGHSADGISPAAVAGLDGQQGISMHAVTGHGDLGAVRKQVAGNVFKTLDETEDIIPAPAVEPGAVVFERKEDFIHLEGRHDGLDQHRGLDGTRRHAQCRLGSDEDIVPQLCFQVTLHLGQVEIRAAAAFQKVFCVVKEEKAEVEEAARNRPAVHQHVFFHQVPPAGPDDEGGGPVVEAVRFARRTFKFDGPVDGIAKVDLSVNGVRPGGAVAVLEIGHVGLCTGIECIDHHLAVHRPGNLHPSIGQVGGHRGHRPVAIADRFGFGQKIRQAPGVDVGLDRLPPGHQFPAAVVELTGQCPNKCHCFGGENTAECIADRRMDGDAVWCVGVAHRFPPFLRCRRASTIGKRDSPRGPQIGSDLGIVRD